MIYNDQMGFIYGMDVQKLINVIHNINKIKEKKTNHTTRYRIFNKIQQIFLMKINFSNDKINT